MSLLQTRGVYPSLFPSN